MAEVRAHGCVFVRSPEMIAYLERVALRLLNVSLYSLESSPLHMILNFQDIADLMLLSARLSARNYLYWTDCTTGEQIACLSYDIKPDAFGSLPVAVLESVRLSGKRGGVRHVS